MKNIVIVWRFDKKTIKEILINNEYKIILILTPKCRKLKITNKGMEELIRKIFDFKNKKEELFILLHETQFEDSQKKKLLNIYSHTISFRPGCINAEIFYGDKGLINVNKEIINPKLNKQKMKNIWEKLEKYSSKKKSVNSNIKLSLFGFLWL